MALNAVPALHMRGSGAVGLVADTALAGGQRYILMVHLRRGHLPVIRVVAAVTLIGGRDVVRRLARRAVIIVAAYAGSQRLVMIHAEQWRPGKRPVTGLASVGSRDMVWWLAGGDGSVMAGYTTINDAAMVKHRRHPRRGAMAIVTFIAAGQMLRRLARGHGSVVATVAGTDYLGVIHSNHRAPGIHTMACVAVIGGGNVVRRLAGRLLPVVAAVAIAGDFVMIDIADRGPGAGAMAGITVVGT